MALPAQMMVLESDAPRYLINLPAKLNAEGIARDVRLADISLGGCCIVGDGFRLSVGDLVAVGAPLIGVRTAKVAWFANSRFGCTFEQPLSPQIAARALKIEESLDLGEPAPAFVSGLLQERFTRARSWISSPLVPSAIALAIAAWAVWSPLH